ncbi:MAG: F0F1 ATP synthase subunit B [Actinomycetota bacterium]|nr:F0F1 ATP synthase subunit B [Actinomycetota bacterium]
MSNLVLLAAEGPNNPILPATNEIIWGTLAFFVLVVLMSKMAYPAVKAAMDARTEHIRTAIDDADRTRDEAQAVMAGYQRQVADAKGEAARIIEEARQTADTLKRDLTARAEAEAAELRQRNAEQIAAERQRVMAEMQGQVATLAIELAEKVVGGSLDQQRSLQLIEDYINTVGTNGAGGAGGVAGSTSARATVDPTGGNQV